MHILDFPWKAGWSPFASAKAEARRVALNGGERALFSNFTAGRKPQDRIFNGADGQPGVAKRGCVPKRSSTSFTIRLNGTYHPVSFRHATPVSGLMFKYRVHAVVTSLNAFYSKTYAQVRSKSFFYNVCWSSKADVVCDDLPRVSGPQE
jgi:hypothetical protein